MKTCFIKIRGIFLEMCVQNTEEIIANVYIIKW
jgi:hypothetical protein